MAQAKPITLCIEATNMTGGFKHLIELLCAAQPEQWDIDRIVVCDTHFEGAGRSAITRQA